MPQPRKKDSILGFQESVFSSYTFLKRSKTDILENLQSFSQCLEPNTLSKVAARLKTKPMSVALAWLLQRSPNILLIPGTSSVEHLRENVAGAGLQLPHEAIKQLNSIAG